VRTAAGLESLDPTRGLVRLLRASVVGSATVAVSLAGHVVGQGAVPSAATLGGSIVVATFVAWALSAARWTPTALTGLLIATQTVLHPVFIAGAGGTGGHESGAMLGGHLAATAVMVLLLTRGESLLWAVVESLSLRVWRRLRPVAVPPRPTVPRPVDHGRPAMPRCWRGDQPPRRGPPLTPIFTPVPA
jgi:hypothetical protein